MLTLSLTNDLELAKKLYLENSIDFNENSLCMLCKNGEEILGYCLFSVTEKRGEVYIISPLEDIALADGILRSSLHVCAERNVMDVFYTDSLSEEFLQKIGFIKNKAEKRLDIDKLFKGCHNCG
ncbi:MAG: hypothetical protein IJP34_00830 [Clostridia bacterium]|nr:hypothetical protein [Clostridia bacterium]